MCNIIINGGVLPIEEARPTSPSPWYAPAPPSKKHKNFEFQDKQESTITQTIFATNILTSRNQKWTGASVASPSIDGHKRAC